MVTSNLAVYSEIPTRALGGSGTLAFLATEFAPPNGDRFEPTKDESQQSTDRAEVCAETLQLNVRGN